MRWMIDWLKQHKKPSKTKAMQKIWLCTAKKNYKGDSVRNSCYLFYIISCFVKWVIASFKPKK